MKLFLPLAFILFLASTTLAGQSSITFYDAHGNVIKKDEIGGPEQKLRTTTPTYDQVNLHNQEECLAHLAVVAYTTQGDRSVTMSTSPSNLNIFKNGDLLYHIQCKNGIFKTTAYK